MDVEVQHDFRLRKMVAERAMDEPMVSWWLEHEHGCPISFSCECTCCGLIWFRGFRAVAGVTVELSPIVFRLN